MRRLTRILILLAVSMTAAAGNTYEHVQVKRIVDGDTVDVAVEIWPRLAQAARVRIYTIDTAEMRAKAECERKLAKAAKAFTSEFLNGGKAVLHSANKLDAFGRVLGDLEVGGVMLSDALTQAGHARKWVPNNQE